MGYLGEQAAPHRGQRLSKLDYGRFLAASLAHLLIHQQDAVGLVTFDTGLRRYIPARSRPSHLRVILQELHGTGAGGESALAPVFHDIAERIHRRSMVVIISDLFDEPERIINALHHFRYRKHEVLVLHVMAEEELTFPFEGQIAFRDLERPDYELRLDPKAVRAEYLDQVRRFLHTIGTACGRMDIDYVPLSTGRSFDAALARYLAQRKSRAR